ncbi:hypothetical protein TREMEDRAFT_58249 [Tremella mesenterica DSM 1558]|uniref:uncharacterized protein n=1 Tax=Tremella mesenterica (strain ATCC 24925 / CBS 8224 / DSM 1558 / NBRC 9311 / NRRL Y-6157 / RJB 2259-6 / UBC 559-6) TaxID=578456 RepID=UPI0003F4924B|nr:uncharacterized protein TREMEDRAFT_58249 [Tremella mesenterica DSM 1558]EIW72096.1 hypothetical protein TREMEDRAFT_58249 [Tremella mesenterica DSM 1558]
MSLRPLRYLLPYPGLISRATFSSSSYLRYSLSDKNSIEESSNSTVTPFEDSPSISTPTSSHSSSSSSSPSLPPETNPNPLLSETTPDAITPTSSTTPTTSTDPPKPETTPKPPLRTPTFSLSNLLRRPIPSLNSQSKNNNKNKNIPRHEPFNTSPHHSASYTHLLTITCSPNNVLLTFSDSVGPMFATITGGSDKQYKGSKKSEPEPCRAAGKKMAMKIDDLISRYPRTRGVVDMRIMVAFKGLYNQRRYNVVSGLLGEEGERVRGLITGVEDRTPAKIGGTRSKKPRRI